MVFWLILIFVIVVMGTLSFFQVPFFTWFLAIGLALLFLSAHPLLLMTFLLLSICIGIPFLRKLLLTSPLMWMLQKTRFFPQISQTEKEALEAGTVWVEKEFFSGRPNIKTLSSQPYPQLTEEEEKFLNHETQTLCSMIDDWKIYQTRTIPEEVDQYIKKNQFLGMIIPKSHGGLGFSHLAHGKILEKICSRSYAVGIYIMVPNSLGPGELLVRYGTRKQKEYYLPRLANGQEIPCFGLTEPRAGSDASAIESSGVLFKDENDYLKIKLNWNKRWITLAPSSTLLGIAFQLEDPEEWLQKGKHIGITCALVSANTPGVTLGNRHDPMTIPFPNGPTEGKDVVISAEEGVIGGIAQAGNGWNMLMDCLGAGRGISLPSLSLASSKKTTRVVTHHSVARQQFGISICKFEGVEEVLSEIAGLTYLSQSMFNYTMSALNQHISSSLCSAIVKYQLTEWARRVVTGGMDIMAGAALSMGSKNLMALSYIGMPIAITVEGANILTRSFIIFGQGVIRVHPYVYKEIQALEKGNRQEFDLYFWKHVSHVFRNSIQLVVLSITRGLLFFLPYWNKDFRAWQKIRWASCLFSVVSEVAMVTLGGRLKIKEKITARLADIVIHLYAITAVLWNGNQKDKEPAMQPLIQWSVNHSFHQIQVAFENIFSNFPNVFLSPIFKLCAFIMRLNPLSLPPSDRLSHQLVQSLINNPSVVDGLSEGIDTSKNFNQQMQKLNEAYQLSIQLKPVERKIKQAIREKKIQKKSIHQIYDEALQKNIINQMEHQQLSQLIQMRWDVIQVDSFTQQAYQNRE